MPDNRFQGSVTVVTGAGRGIGVVIARQIVAEGGTVYLADLNWEAVREVAQEIGAAARAIRCDVSVPDEVEAAFGRISEEAGGADFLVNCAGAYAPLVPTLNITEAEYDIVLDSNLKGTFLCCQAALRQMMAKGRGAIVNFSSLAGRQTSPALGAHYTAAKAGVLGLTRHLAKEFGSRGVRVNAIAPGTTEGERVAGLLTQDDRERQISGIPLGRFATADDLCSVVLFLLSDAAGYITGATIDVNGGALTI